MGTQMAVSQQLLKIQLQAWCHWKALALASLFQSPRDHSFVVQIEVKVKGYLKVLFVTTIASDS
jgi:hypothetical protein